MAKNMAFRIKIEIVETEMEATSDRCPQEEANGAFSVMLPEADELNILALARSGGVGCIVSGAAGGVVAAFGAGG
jgi:hypothetical protein